MKNGIFYGSLEPDIVAAGCINIYKNVWPEPEKTIELIENECSNLENGLYWNRAKTIEHGLDQNARTNYDLGITNMALYHDNEVAKNIHNQMHFILQAALTKYQDTYKIDGTLYHEFYNMLKYSGGQKYDQHFDGTTHTGRSVSSICYLNDNYVGGEIEFVNFDIIIKPEPGMLILFPSNYAYSHIAHPVTEGTKYAIVTWLADRMV